MRKETLYRERAISWCGYVLVTRFYKDPEYRIRHNPVGQAEQHASNAVYYRASDSAGVWIVDGLYHQVTRPATPHRFKSWRLQGVLLLFQFSN